MSNIVILGIHDGSVQGVVGVGDDPKKKIARIRMFLDNGDVVDENFVFPDNPEWYTEQGLLKVLEQKAFERIKEIEKKVKGEDSKLVDKDGAREFVVMSENMKASVLEALEERAKEENKGQPVVQADPEVIEEVPVEEVTP